MKRHQILVVSMALAVVVSACSPAQIPTGTPPESASTQVIKVTTLTATPTVSVAPTPTPSGLPDYADPESPLAISPVEFVSQISGDADPLYWPSGLALDPQGNLFVADTLNHRIQKFDSNGKLLATIGSEGSGDGQFDFVWGDPEHNLPGAGLAFDGQGNLYVTDMGNFRIQKFDSQVKFVTQWGSIGLGDGQFTRPFDLAVDSKGNIYVIDDRSDPPGRIQKFDGSGYYLGRFGEGLFSDPGLIAIDQDDNLFVTDVARGIILKLDSHGNLLATFGGTGSGEGQFRGPLGIDVDRQGNIYVVDSGNSRIQKLDTDGKFLCQWGTVGSGEGQFNEPYGIQIDEQGNFYISDQFNNRIQEFRLVDQ